MLRHRERRFGPQGDIVDVYSITSSASSCIELGISMPRVLAVTILKEAEQHVGSKYVDQVLDSLYVIEMAMRHFYMRAEMGKNADRKEALVDQDYKDAATQFTFVLSIPTMSASSASCVPRPGRNPYENPRKSSS